MIWEMLLPSGELLYRDVQGTLNSTKYIKLFQDFALPTVESHLGNNWLRQHDNAPTHSSEATQLFLEEKGVRFLGWPCPLGAPTEMLSRMCGTCLVQTFIETVQQEI